MGFRGERRIYAGQGYWRNDKAIGESVSNTCQRRMMLGHEYHHLEWLPVYTAKGFIVLWKHPLNYIDTCSLYKEVHLNDKEDTCISTSDSCSC